VTNSFGKVIGFINKDKGVLSDAEEKSLCIISKEGKINSLNGLGGTIDPYTQNNFLVVASYLFYFDYALIQQ